MSSTVAPTTTLAPKDYPRKVRFSYPLSNCTDAFVARNRDAIKTQIGVALNISANTMTDFNATCGSVVITYTQTHSADLSSEEAVALLKQKIEQGALNITVEGQLLVADSASLVVSIDTPAYATPATPTEKDDSLSGGAIAGIVIGVLVFLLLIALVVYFLCGKKHTRKDNQIEPNANDVELRGKSNRAYQGSP